MRTALLFPLALAAAAAWGCGTASEGTEQTAFGVPRRDLTLSQAGAPEAEVASPVELANTPVQPKAHRPQRARRPAAVPRPEVTGPGGTPAAPASSLAPTHADLAPLTTSAAPEAADPHALAPGQTVTVIPASSGPSTPRDWTDQRPSGAGRGTGVRLGGHGGGCRPRGGATFRLELGAGLRGPR